MWFSLPLSLGHRISVVNQYVIHYLLSLYVPCIMSCTPHLYLSYVSSHMHNTPPLNWFSFLNHFIVVSIFIQMKIYWSIGLNTIFMILGQLYVCHFSRTPCRSLWFRWLARGDSNTSTNSSFFVLFCFVLLCAFQCVHTNTYAGI